MRRSLLPRRRCALYPALALVLSAGAPLGLLLVRAGGLSPPDMRSELAASPGTYAYVALSTALVFAAFALVVGRQADRLLALSQTDPLTGLRNARFFRDRLEPELARARRYREPLSVLFIDLDGLKQINDTRGHDAGDAALVRVAEAIRFGARAADVAARWAGDEFVLLAPSTPAAAANALAERIRAAISAQATPDVPVTVSVGIATFEGAGPAPDARSVLREADGALYRAKARGRNAVAAAR